MPRESQATINAWQESIHGPLADTRSLLLRCQREMVEAMMAADIPLDAMIETVVDEHRRQSAKPSPPADVGAEITDVQLMLYAAARSTGTDLAASVDRLMTELRATRFGPAPDSAGRPFQLFRLGPANGAATRAALAERYGPDLGAAFATWPEFGGPGPGWEPYAPTRRAIAHALLGAIHGRHGWDEAERALVPALDALVEHLVARMHTLYAHNPLALRCDVEDRLLRSPAGQCAAIAAIACPNASTEAGPSDPTLRAAAILVDIGLGKRGKEDGDRLAAAIAGLTDPP